MELWRIVRIAAWACLAGVFAVFAFAPENTDLGAAFFVMFIPLMIFSGIAKLKDPYVKRAKEEKKVQRKARQDLVRRQQTLDSTPVAAVLVATDEYKRPSRLTYTAIGGLMAGPVGVALGAHLGKKTATFSVRYASGRTGVETVDLNSVRFKKLSALCEE